MELLQELLLTAFVGLIFSFLIAKLVSTAVNGGDHVKLYAKSVGEIVRLDKELKLEGAKSNKRVRFAVDDEVAEKVDRFVGEEGSIGELDESCGKKGGKLETCLNEKRVEEILKEGVIGVNKDLGQLIFEEKIENEVGNDEIGSDDVVVGQNGEVGGVLEELGVEERFECGGIEGIMVNNALEGLIIVEKDESELGGDGISVGFVSDDGIGDQSGGISVLKELVGEERSEDSGNEGDSLIGDLKELIVVEENENEEADDGRSVGLGGDDVVGDRSGEFRVLEGLFVEEKIEGDVKEGDVVDSHLDGRNENEEAKNENEEADDVVGGQTEEIRVWKDLVSEEMMASSVKGGNIVNSAFDESVVDNTIENEVAGHEVSVKLVSEGFFGDPSGEVREDQGTGIGDELDEGNKGDGLLSNEDDDWEGIERSDLEKVFATATSYVDSRGKDDRLLNLGSDVQMQLYGLQKVAMEGPCYEGQPMALKVSARAKWNAWQRLGNMSPEVAMEQYLSLLSDMDPGWMQGHSAQIDGKADNSEAANPGVPETNESPFLVTQSESIEMNFELKLNNDGRDLDI